MWCLAFISFASLSTSHFCRLGSLSLSFIWNLLDIAGSALLYSQLKQWRDDKPQNIHISFWYSNFGYSDKTSKDFKWDRTLKSYASCLSISSTPLCHPYQSVSDHLPSVCILLLLSRKTARILFYHSKAGFQLLVLPTDSVLNWHSVPGFSALFLSLTL